MDVVHESDSKKKDSSASLFLKRNKSNFPLLLLGILIVSFLFLFHEGDITINAEYEHGVIHHKANIISRMEQNLDECKLHLAKATGAAIDALQSAQTMKASSHSLPPDSTTTKEPVDVAVGVVAPPCPPPPPQTQSQSQPQLQLQPPLPSKKWLTIGIPTISRPVDYLGTTLHSILSQLPDHPGDPLYDDMVVVVMNMQNEHHEFYEKAKDKYKFPHPKSRYVIFSNEFEHTIPDPMIGATDEGGANKPGYKVSKWVLEWDSEQKNKNALN